MNEVSGNELSMNEVSGNPDDCRHGRFAIVAARFNRRITDQLIAGAQEAFDRHGIQPEQIHCAWVPGAFEIPMVCGKLSVSGEYAAIIALGAVIRGETPHFEYVAGECARGIAWVNLQGNTPVIFGVLTTDTVEQAVERADLNAKNKGATAVVAALEMASLMKQL